MSILSEHCELALPQARTLSSFPPNGYHSHGSNAKKHSLSQYVLVLTHARRPGVECAQTLAPTLCSLSSRTHADLGWNAHKDSLQHCVLSPAGTPTFLLMCLALTGGVQLLGIVYRENINNSAIFHRFGILATVFEYVIVFAMTRYLYLEMIGDEQDRRNHVARLGPAPAPVLV